uniref:Uncharacterized protein n=1 Tax=Oryza sativa subsp. japonica TaxID=39947 RepID=Q10PM5_ORYSJ|nr:hypothetical protein LOC_Os03g12739 [Oryza sativa Japonica Group]
MPDLPHPRNGTARTHHCTAGLAPRLYPIKVIGVAPYRLTL